MDTKSKAAFVNTASEEQSIICPKCGKKNRADRKSCFSCGAELSSAADTKSMPAFTSITDDVQQNPDKTGKYIEPPSVFAEGLPSWDIVPPQVMVRRR